MIVYKVLLQKKKIKNEEIYRAPLFPNLPWVAQRKRAHFNVLLSEYVPCALPRLGSEEWACHTNKDQTTRTVLLDPSPRGTLAAQLPGMLHEL